MASPQHFEREILILLLSHCHGGSVGWKFLVRLCSKLALELRSSMSLPCFFLWLEFKVTAGPGLRSLGSFPLPSRLLARSNDVTYMWVTQSCLLLFAGPNFGFTCSLKYLHTWQTLHPCSPRQRQLQRAKEHGRRWCFEMLRN